jgi:hypothetical protein
MAAAVAAQCMAAAVIAAPLNQIFMIAVTTTTTTRADRARHLAPDNQNKLIPLRMSKPSPFRRGLFHVSLVFSVSLSCACLARPERDTNLDREPPTVVRLAQARPTLHAIDHAIALAAGYIEHASYAEGRFVYLVDVNTGQESASYNILRHAGTMYALGVLYRTHHDPRLAETLKRTAVFLQKNYIGPGPKRSQQAVWSRAEVAELGGTGLGIVALVQARQVDPAVVSLARLEALGRFLLFLQQEDGDFVDKYTKTDGPVLNWRSLYYPGEAALGLISLYEVNHSRRWINAASRALAFLAESRAGQSQVPPDHWALIATAKLLPHCTNVHCPVSREALIGHAIQVCNELLDEQQVAPDDPDVDGSFSEDGRTAPTATSLEGLLAAMEFLPQREKTLRERISAALPRGIAFLLRAQIRAGPYAGGMPRVPITASTDDDDAVRIDYVQHAMSAWLRYRSFVSN